MKLFYECFVRPFWMELLGVGFLSLSIFVKGQWIVNVGFACLIAGTIVNGVSGIKQKFQDWRHEKTLAKTAAEIRRGSAYNETKH